jgi:hypothetical protein
MVLIRSPSFQESKLERCGRDWNDVAMGASIKILPEVRLPEGFGNTQERYLKHQPESTEKETNRYAGAS